MVRNVRLYFHDAIFPVDFDMAPRILIVEDEILVGMMLRRRLCEHAYEVCEIAADGEQARVFVERYQPDLLLMDVILPGGMDGVTVMQTIRAKYRMPVIFFTANHLDEELKKRAASVEPMVIFDKMTRFELLLESIERLLKAMPDSAD